MNSFDVIFVAIVQGLSEFLPISSSGHIVLTGKILNHTENQFFFNVTIHFGTLISILVFFRKRIISLLKNSLKEIKEKTISDNLRLVFYIALATLPAGLAGLILKKRILFFYQAENIIYLSLFFLVMAGYLYQTKNRKVQDKTITLKSALIIGLVQCLALLPGISRSGVTITTALLLKVKREEAFNFSFFIGIPLFFGAFLLEILELLTTPLNTTLNNPLSSEASSFFYLVAMAMVVSFLFGWLALKLLHRLVLHNHFYRFAYYLVGVAGITLWLSL